MQKIIFSGLFLCLLFLMPINTKAEIYNNLYNNTAKSNSSTPDYYNEPALMIQDVYSNNTSLFKLKSSGTNGSDANLDDDPNGGGPGIGTLPVNDDFFVMGAIILLYVIYITYRERKQQTKSS